MRRKTFKRDLLGTLFMLGVLLLFCVLIILGEHYLENFKSH